MAYEEVKFLIGTSQRYKTITPDNYTFYYTTDDNGVYLGSTRLSNVYTKKTAEWNANINFIGQTGTFYIYSDWKTETQADEQTGQTRRVTIPGIKLGDGQAYLIDLPFLNDFSSIKVTEQEKARWNNKLSLGENSVTYQVSPVDENLVFTVV